MRYLAGFGVKTAGVICAGYDSSPKNSTEEYNGTSYTSSNNLGTARYSTTGFGVETAGLACGGLPGTLNVSEEYNGSTWSEGNNLITTYSPGWLFSMLFKTLLFLSALDMVFLIFYKVKNVQLVRISESV